MKTIKGERLIDDLDCFKFRSINCYAIDFNIVKECLKGKRIIDEAELLSIMEGKKGSSNWGHVNKLSQAYQILKEILKDD